jgi:hypothetical protein
VCGFKYVFVSCQVSTSLTPLPSQAKRQANKAKLSQASYTSEAKPTKQSNGTQSKAKPGKQSEPKLS